MISEFCSGPDVFLHYIEKRIEIQDEPVIFVNDELDFFGAYLDCRLQADKLWMQDGKPVDLVCLSGWSKKFDQLMEYRRGERKTPPTIRLKVPNEIESILLELRSRTNDEGARWIAFALLSMSDKSLEAIAQGVKDIRKAELSPGMFRRMTYQDGDTVVSIVASLDLPTPMLRKRTALRATLEKYRRKVSRSIGIGIMVADNSKPFECATWVEGPWEYDEKMEKTLNSEPAFTPVPGQRLPGRNAPCVCGSGKKFKKCCLPKMEIPIRKTK